MKKSILLLLMVVVSASSFAQSQEKAMKQYGFWDNWFMQGQVGGSVMLSENWDESVGDVITPKVAISVGKYFSPQVGARFQVAGWSHKANNLNGVGTYSWNHVSGYADALFNLSNIFTTYKENRKFNFVGFIGIGYNHGFKFKDKSITDNITTTDNIVSRLGLQANFRLNKSWDLNFETSATLIDDSYNGYRGGATKYDGYGNLLVGLTYKFKNSDGGKTFALVQVEDMALIKALNEKINDQREIIDNIKPCPEVKPATVVKTIVVNNKGLLTSVVTFVIGKSAVEKNQEIHVYNVAQYIKANSDVKVLVTGYADAKTGTSKFNEKLSKKRAENVAKMLINKYGVAENRVQVGAYGSEKQVYEKNEWNRVVIFTAE